MAAVMVNFRIDEEVKKNMEQACKERQADGRLIPVPRDISAGCGLAWCAGLESREMLKSVMESIGIREQDMHECMV